MNSMLLCALVLAPLAAPSLQETTQDQGEELKTVSLLEARKGFETTLIENAFEADGPAEAPPEGVFELAHYPSPVGDLVAYRTPDPGDGKKHPIMIWAHGGFGGIGPWLWEDYGILTSFLDEEIAILCPSWRGENDNPGSFELFYGEVDDALAAIDYAAKLEWVDPQRIYFAGHSTGGTITLLTALASTKLRAAFSFGGAPDLWSVVEDGEGYGNTPFDFENEKESYLRSATNFVQLLKVPTFYFEGEESWWYVQDALLMQVSAKVAEAPFQVHAVTKGDHFNYLGPYLGFAAALIGADRGKSCNIELDAESLEKVQEDFLKERLDEMRAARLVEDREMLELLAELGVDLSEEARFVFRMIVYYEREQIEGAAAKLQELGFVDPEIKEAVDEDEDIFYTLAVHAKLVPSLENVHQRSAQVMEVADEFGGVYLTFAKAR